MNDAEYLRRYAQEGSEEAFAELVRLRIGLVYSAALRQTFGDAQRAQDVTQAVFTDLARKAATLCRHSALVGWLYTSTRYTAAKMARSEQRRRAREQEAYTMHEDLASPTPEIPAERLRPLLDDAMHHLPEADRRALLLRFFDGCSMAELGRSLGLSEATAKKRVERALEKLRSLLAQRGLSSTLAAVGAALSQEAAAASAPSGLAALVSGSAVVAASMAAPSLGLLSFLTTQKFAAGLMGLVLAGAVATGTYEIRVIRDMRMKAVNVRADSRVEFDRVAAIQVVDPPQVERDELEGADPQSQPAGYLPTQTQTNSPSLGTPSSSTPAFPPPVSDMLSVKPDLPATPMDTGNGTNGVQIFDSFQLDQPPVPLSQARPTYPLGMQNSHIAGRVVVDFVVDPTGLVHNAFAASSSRSEFESAAVNAVSQWKFKPGRRDGRAVNTHMQAPIVFTLDSHD